MRDIRMEFRLTPKEKRALTKLSGKLGLPLSDYIRRKLFYDNEDLADQEDRYVSPPADKSQLVTISVLYKTYYLIQVMLEKQGVGSEVLIDLEKHALDYARQQRERYGYRILRTESESRHE